MTDIPKLIEELENDAASFYRQAKQMIRSADKRPVNELGDRLRDAAQALRSLTLPVGDDELARIEKRHETDRGHFGCSAHADRATLLRRIRGERDSVIEECCAAVCLGCKKGYALGEVVWPSKGAVLGHYTPGSEDPFLTCHAFEIRALKSTPAGSAK